MCARSSEHPAQRRAARQAHGFTMVELITVMVLIGVLAVVAMPRLNGAMGLQSAAWRDQLQAGALHARTLATGHRRLVCLSVATGELRLSMASANPASSCGSTIPGPDGDARWAVDSQGITLTPSPQATLYFQPDGRITSDGAGNTPTNFSVGVAGEAALQIIGQTGHVE